MRLKNIFKLETYKNRINYFFEDIRVKKLIEQKYKDYWIIVPGTGIGENFIVASLMKQFKKENNGKILFVIHDKQRIDFLSKFNSIDEFFLTSKYFINRKLFYEYNDYKIKQKGKLWVVFEEDNNLTKYYNRRLNAINLHKFILGLDLNVPLDNIEINREEINHIKNKYDIKNNAVLLCPHANTLNSNALSIDFWKNLADLMTFQGYKVFVNSNDENFKDYNCVFDSILNTLCIAELCICTIAFRSGFTDVLAGTVSKNKKLFIIYPYQKNKIDKKYEKSLLEYDYFSLKSFNKKNIVEYLFKNNEEKLCEDIVRFITDK